MFRPEDIGMLRRVFAEHCESCGIKTDIGRESVATSLIGFYKSGIRSSLELHAALDKEENRPPTILNY
ncbi:hypothetical protein DY251_09930 [Mesorhizobium denitrificans]|uniref:Uncharacterized protein n=1 Tax=Mesorhizobium denitrificans TaxID=2294114 RepID=A0A371XF91_9HYPH|nr:hypothetical protein DY251_09930 [Mesorhizobium denitrificans]